MSRVRPATSAATYAIFAHLLEETCGIHYGPKDSAILATKLEAHAIELGFSSLLDYYYLLRYDDPHGAELQKLVEAILVHETYFFRELAPLEQLVTGHLTDIVRQRDRARVWSAACSTGEEAFTLAMLLDAAGLLDHVDVVATDLSATAVARAGAGRHGPRALREGHPRQLACRYLERDRHGYKVTPRIRDAVQFSTLNLLDDDAVKRLGRFDAVLCRNVLIYFRSEQVVRVVDRLTRALEPGGLIAVGIAESLLRFGTALVCEERGGSFFYRSAR